MGRMSKISQAMFRASRCSVESCVGRMIHLITRDTTSGDRFVDFRVERKVRIGLGVVRCRARRWSVQSGMAKNMIECSG